MPASGCRLALPWQADGFENLGRAVFRHVVRADDLHRVAALLFGERPEAGQQAPLLVVGDDGDRHQRFVRLPFGQLRADLGDGCRGGFGERLFIDGEVFGVPFHAFADLIIQK